MASIYTFLENKHWRPYKGAFSDALKAQGTPPIVKKCQDFF